jgi:cation transport ATPase
VTLILTFFAFFFAYSGPVDWLPMPQLIWDGTNVRNLMTGCTVLTGLVAIVNSATVGGGLISFFKLRANADSLTAFAILAAIGQGIYGMVRPESVDPAALNFYFPIACLAMLFNALGKMTLINRIQLNFRVLGSDREKKAVLPVENPEFCHEFAGDALARKPVIAYSVKAGFFTDFLGLSYSDKYAVGINRSVAPVCVIGSLVVAASTFFLTGSMSAAISAVTAILCLCATLSSTFIENIPLGKMAKKITPQGGMVSGSKAVEDFCDAKAIVLTETDLFGKGRVTLRGIKAFSQGRIDEAILDAASVLCALDGSLAPLFLKMINNNRKLLKKADNLVFENGMGVSAWIDSRRVLIGNRKLMLNHGITLPTDSYERGEAPDAVGEPIYLSNSGEVSARFLVDYAPSEELAAALDHAAARGLRLLISTSDANINAHKVWEAYGYPENLITVLPSDRLAEFHQMSTPRQEAIAEIVYTGRAPAMVRSILACVNARSSMLSATVIALVQMIVGYGLVAFLAFMGAIGSLDVTGLLLYQMFWFIAIFIVQQVRQS